MSESPVRRPAVAGQFYPNDYTSCVRMIEQCLPARPSPDLPEKIVAGLVPHAGWVFSGAVAARVFAAIHTQGTPETFVLLSAVHRWGAPRSAVYARGRWATPLGEVEVDEELAAAVIEGGDGLLINSPEAHSGEHSVEVQVPFIQYLFPEAKILPILIPPDEDAARAGAVVGQAVSAAHKPTAVVGTTDLTHYGATYYGFAPAGTGERALEWVRANDERVINLILSMQAEEILPETAGHHNACGGGAVAGTIAAARALGAEKGYLLEYTTSHHVAPRGPATDFVGYAAIVF
jgi:AmmeMemoRadiSam system protein B